MKIMENKPAAALRKTGKASSANSGASAFALPDAGQGSSTAAATGAGSIGSVSDIGMLLAVQGLNNEGEPRRQAIRDGHETLDALDGLKADVLAGRIAPSKIQNLVRLVGKQKQDIDDPGLKNVLDHIELRARVELAKLEMRG